MILDHDHDVVDRFGQPGRNEIQCVADQFLEPRRVHPDGH